MRITRLALTEIRRHRRYELRPAAGLTVIRGPNESGKSTLQLALELVLFRRATTTAAEIATVRSWDAEGDPMVELEFDLDGTPGRLAKRFAGTKGSVRLELDGVVDSDPGRVDQLLAGATGIPSEKFLRSTASVRHFEMDDLDRDERALRDRLQQSIGGGDVGASKARQRLAERIAKMRATGAKNPGPLRILTDEIGSLTVQLRDGEMALERLSRDRAALAAATADRAALEAEVKAAEAELAEAETAARLGAERRTTTDRYEHLRRAAELAERLAAAETAPPTLLPVVTLAADAERLRALELEAANLAAARAAVVVPIVPPEPIPSIALEPEPRPATPPAPRPIQVPPAGPGRVIAAALLLLAVVAVLSGMAQGGFPQFLGLVLAAGALIASVLVFRRDRMVRGVRATLIATNEAAAAQATRDAEIAAAALAAQTAATQAAAEADARRVADAQEARRLALEGAADAERRLAEIAARTAAVASEASAILAELGVPDRAAAAALLVSAQQHAAIVDGVRAELRGLLGTDMVPPLAELRQARDEAAVKAEMGGHALDGMGATGADPEAARQRATSALRSARVRLQNAVGEQGQAEGRVSQNTADAEAVAAIAERLTSAQEELVRQERKLRVYQQTLDAITAAEAATMQKAARFLERRMGTDIARITGGRYDRVRVDENDLAITVWSPEREAWVDATTQLSKGTADQLYLAARLGLVRQVTQDRRPPLVFDDPFVTFDDDRALRAMAVLKELAADHQVLYLTCSDRYDDAADLVVELPAPAIVHVEPGAVVPEPPAREEPFALTLSLDLHTPDA